MRGRRSTSGNAMTDVDTSNTIDGGIDAIATVAVATAAASQLAPTRLTRLSSSRSIIMHGATPQLLSQASLSLPASGPIRGASGVASNTLPPPLGGDTHPLFQGFDVSLTNYTEHDSTLLYRQESLPSFPFPAGSPGGSDHTSSNLFGGDLSFVNFSRLNTGIDFNHGVGSSTNAAAMNGLHFDLSIPSHIRNLSNASYGSAHGSGSGSGSQGQGGGPPPHSSPAANTLPPPMSPFHLNQQTSVSSMRSDSSSKPDRLLRSETSTLRQMNLLRGETTASALLEIPTLTASVSNLLPDPPLIPSPPVPTLTSFPRTSSTSSPSHNLSPPVPVVPHQRASTSVQHMSLGSVIIPPLKQMQRVAESETETLRVLFAAPNITEMTFQKRGEPSITLMVPPHASSFDMPHGTHYSIRNLSPSLSIALVVSRKSSQQRASNSFNPLTQPVSPTHSSMPAPMVPPLFPLQPPAASTPHRSTRSSRMMPASDAAQSLSLLSSGVLPSSAAAAAASSDLLPPPSTFLLTGRNSSRSSGSRNTRLGRANSVLTRAVDPHHPLVQQAMAAQGPHTGSSVGASSRSTSKEQSASSSSMPPSLVFNSILSGSTNSASSATRSIGRKRKSSSIINPSAPFDLPAAGYAAAASSNALPPSVPGALDRSSSKRNARGNISRSKSKLDESNGVGAQSSHVPSATSASAASVSHAASVVPLPNKKQKVDAGKISKVNDVVRKRQELETKHKELLALLNDDSKDPDISASSAGIPEPLQLSTRTRSKSGNADHAHSSMIAGTSTAKTLHGELSLPTDPTLLTDLVLNPDRTFYFNCSRCPAASSAAPSTATDSKRFNSYRNYIYHLLTHAPRFRCEICNKNFPEKYKLTRHKQSHTNEQPFGCTFDGCTKRFKRSEDLKLHQRVHTGEKPFACTRPGCDKRFRRKDFLIEHERWHSGERPFACPYANAANGGCEKRFTSTSHLRHHVRRHTGERPYACPESGCGRKFISWSCLKAHSWTHSKADKKFVCDEKGCDKKYHAATQLAWHKKLHEKRKVRNSSSAAGMVDDMRSEDEHSEGDESDDSADDEHQAKKAKK